MKKRPEAIWAMVLFTLAFLQYANTLGHDYAWDDDIVIVYNARVQKGFAGIPDHFAFRTRQNFEDFTGYRPITMTSFSIDIGLFGLNPSAGHAVNVLLFALMVVVLFRTLRQLFPNYHAAFAFFIALLFAVHPIHVEAVANIKSRDEILALLFALLALHHFVRHYQTGKWLQLGLSALFLTLGALSKEGALTYLLVIPLAIVVLMEGDWKRKAIALAKYPVIVLCLVGIFWVLTGKLPGSSTPVAPKGFVEEQILGNCMAAPEASFVQGDWQRIGNSGFLFWKHVEKFFWPVDLVYFSGYNMYGIKDWTADRLQLGIQFFLLLALTAGGIVFWRRLRPLVFGYAYFAGTIVVYLQLPGFLLADTVADRFLFMPSVGLCIVVVAALYALLGLDGQRNPLSALRAKDSFPKAMIGRAWAISAILLGLGLLLGGMTVARNRVWRDNLTLFSHDLPLLENCARAHYYYASELVKGLPTAKDPAQSAREIEAHYQRAIAITPLSYYAYVRLGQFYQNQKNYAAQAKLMAQALTHYPAQAELWHSSGMALYYLADYADAATALQQALAHGSPLEETHEFLARAYERGGQHAQALTTLNAAITQRPDYAFYYDVLSDTYFDMGDTAQSFPPILKLLEIDPQNPVWWRKIIGRYQMIGDNERAGYYYQEALRRGVSL